MTETFSCLPKKSQGSLLIADFFIKWTSFCALFNGAIRILLQCSGEEIYRFLMMHSKNRTISSFTCVKDHFLYHCYLLLLLRGNSSTYQQSYSWIHLFCVLFPVIICCCKQTYCHHLNFKFTFLNFLIYLFVCFLKLL